MPIEVGEWHRVLYVDGIWTARGLVALICCSDEHGVSWYMARSETSRAWSALMDPSPLRTSSSLTAGRASRAP